LSEPYETRDGQIDLEDAREPRSSAASSEHARSYLLEPSRLSRPRSRCPTRRLGRSASDAAAGEITTTYPSSSDAMTPNNFLNSLTYELSLPKVGEDLVHGSW
jgi:hypothetical protein